MSTITFADVVHQAVTFSSTIPSEKIILELIDTRWFQRLRDVSQTANTRLVYMFSEHSRFGHCVGVAYLANVLMNKLASQFSEFIEPYRLAVSAASILHDIGHLAPGSHTAYKTWFPGQKDEHEELACRIIRENEEIAGILRRYHAELPELVAKVLLGSPDLPPWTWEIISGGGWNVDRGNWCIVDSVLGGVSYGKYNIPALIDSMIITDGGHLALLENRLDAMMHFAVSRHALYRQVYQHRVLLAADALNTAVVQRAREIACSLPFCDDVMKRVLTASRCRELDVQTAFAMRESWWRYHLYRWMASEDRILGDLCQRLLDRRLLKTVRLAEEPATAERTRVLAREAVLATGFEPRYYLHEISSVDMLISDSQSSMRVAMEDGSLRQLSEADPLFASVTRDSNLYRKSWLCLPREAKEYMQRRSREG